MFSLFFLLIAGFLIGLVATPVIRNAFVRAGVMDQPDAERKAHAAPIPRVGGVAIAAAYMGAFVLFLLSPLSASSMIQENMDLVRRLMPALLVVFFVGLLDDIRGLKPWQKLAGQVAAAGLVFAEGVRLQGILGLAVADVWLSLPLTVLWLVTCTNAFNLIDGVDGLAAGVGLFATLTTMTSGLLSGNVALALATAPLAGALVAFLRYNFNPATIFLGDSGSLSIGFLLGVFALVWGQKTATLLGLTAPLMAFAIPLLDVGLSVVRRFLGGKPIFQADRGHIHHRLLDRGMTPRRVALVLYGMAAMFAVLSLLWDVLHNRLGGLVLILFCAVSWMGIQNLGYVELDMAGRMLWRGAFRRLLESHMALRGAELALIGARTEQERWEAVRDTSKGLGFAHVSMRLGMLEREEWLHEDEEMDKWTMEVPLGNGNWVRLGRGFHTEVRPSVVAPYADLLKRILGRRGEDEERGKEMALAAKGGV